MTRHRHAVVAAIGLLMCATVSCSTAAGEEAGRPAPKAMCPNANPPPYSNGFRAKIGQDRGSGYGIRDVRADGPTGLTLADCSFSPTLLRAAPWRNLIVNVTNVSDAEHNFSVPAESISVDVQPGETIPVKVQVPGTGGIEFICRFHRDQGMIGAVAAFGYDLPDVLAAPPGDLALGSIGSGAYRGVGHIGPGTTNLDNKGRAAEPSAGNGKDY